MSDMALADPPTAVDPAPNFRIANRLEGIISDLVRQDDMFRLLEQRFAEDGSEPDEWAESGAADSRTAIAGALQELDLIRNDMLGAVGSTKHQCAACDTPAGDVVRFTGARWLCEPCWTEAFKSNQPPEVA